MRVRKIRYISEKEFNKKIYFFAGAFRLRKDAKECKESYKKQGGLARIIPINKKQIKYLVYARYKK